MGLQNWFKRAFAKKNCDDCLKLLELILDGEASEEQKKAFTKHINDCKSCYEYYNLELTIKKVLKEKIESQPVPEDLVDSIKTHVRNNL